MRIYDGKIYRDLTEEELMEIQSQHEKAEQEYWTNIPYDEAVNTEIRKRYSESQEFALLRQKDKKPDEYNAYYFYCEECKAKVKTLFNRYGVVYESEG